MNARTTLIATPMPQRIDGVVHVRHTDAKAFPIIAGRNATSS